MEFTKEFKNPEGKNRIKPFWFWNGDMDKEEIKKQIIEMKAKGLGGAFICARQGLKVPYLSKNWFELVRYACEEAKKIGIENWLYDEYPYPSGMSGGEVLLENPEAKHTLLKTYKFYTTGEILFRQEIPFSKILLAKAFKQLDDGSFDYINGIDIKDSIGNLQVEEIYQQTGLTSYNNKRYFSYKPTHILEINLPKGQYKIEIFAQEDIKDFKYYGSYFDPCNSEAVKSFLETTHEKYKTHLGEEFGKTVFGMFSDETGLLSKIPWSKQIVTFFKEDNGYDLIPVLPALTNQEFHNSFKIRYDFIQSIHKLFVNSYHRQISNWCVNNKLLYATEVPSMRMSTQRYSDVIGGDACHEKLGQSLEWIYDNYLTHYRVNAKAVNSLARQLDKPYSMIESFHSVGWSMTIQDAKCMIDYMGVSGINLFNFHAFYYTISSIKKHDAPPSQFIQNPYWKHYKILADYVGRVSVFNTYTNSDTKIAILDPVVSLFARLGNPFHRFNYAGDDNNEKEVCNLIHKSWIKVAKTILFEQLDYDHLDAEILREAKIVNGEIILGRVKYSVLVLPPMEAIESFATDIIKEFLNSGGKVIFVGQLPNIIIDRENVKQEYEQIIEHKNSIYIKSKNILEDDNAIKQLISVLHDEAKGEVKFLVKEEFKKECVTSVRKGEKGDIFIYISNQSSKIINGKVEIINKRLKYVNILSFETGEKYKICFNDYLDIELKSFESICIEFSSEDNQDLAVFSKPKNIYTLSTKEDAEVSISGQNIFRFEYFDISTNMVEWVNVDTKTLIEQVAQTKIINGDKLNFKSEFGTPKNIYIDYPIKVYYKATFKVNEISKNINLLMDRDTISGEFNIKINGDSVNKNDFKDIFINDQNNIIVDITSLIKKGVNEIFVEVTAYKNSDGIRDIIYLSGDFGVLEVCNEMVIDKKPNRAVYRNTYTEGFPYYSGTTSFKQIINLDEKEINLIEAFEFDFGNSRYDLIELIINGKSMGVRAFTPYQFNNDKGALFVGENEVIIKVTNSLANMLDGVYFDYEQHRLIRI